MAAWSRIKMSVDDASTAVVDALMMRGEFMRMLRQLELADLAEREVSTNSDEYVVEEKKTETDVVGSRYNHPVVPNQSILKYENYLCNQRYYDDLKHVDYHFIDYGSLGHPEETGKVIIEQRKSLGKGGMCWDAGFILAEHLVMNLEAKTNSDISLSGMPKILELGSGTGLAGIMLAKSLYCHVTITDLPELMDCMICNIKRNFNHPYIKGKSKCDTQTGAYCNHEVEEETEKRSKGVIDAKVLRWGELDSFEECTYDILIAADVVASIYDPSSLAHTFYSLSHARSKIFISYKIRMSEPHQAFETEMRRYFHKFETVKPSSRNKNPNVWILEIGKRIES